MGEHPLLSDDGVLIQQAIAGSHSALERLLLARHDYLFATVNRRIPARFRSEIGAEDVLQDVFIATFQSIDQFVPAVDGAFDRWLSRIAKSKLISALRRASAAKRGGGRNTYLVDPASPSQSVMNLLDIVAVNEHTPSRSMTRREALLSMAQAMDQINDNYRQVIQHRYFDGLSVDETARKMGRSARSVEMLCHRALRRLADVMGSSSQFFHSRA